MDTQEEKSLIEMAIPIINEITDLHIKLGIEIEKAKALTRQALPIINIELGDLNLVDKEEVEALKSGANPIGNTSSPIIDESVTMDDHIRIGNEQTFNVESVGYVGFKFGSGFSLKNSNEPIQTNHYPSTQNASFAYEGFHFTLDYKLGELARNRIKTSIQLIINEYELANKKD